MITTGLVLHLLPLTPRTIAEVAAQKLAWAAPRYGINTLQREAHWIAQLAAESSLIPKEENLWYSAERLCQVWPSRFPTLASAKPFAYNPQALAERVYGGREDLGNDRPGDGARYIGRGLIQLTGKHNYELYGQMTGFNLVAQPELLLQFGVSALVAGAYWKTKGINAAADKNDIEKVTRMVNGGAHGLERRREFYTRAFDYLRRSG